VPPRRDAHHRRARIQPVHDMILGTTAECLRSKGARAKEDAAPEILGAHCFPVLKTCRTMF